MAPGERGIYRTESMYTFGWNGIYINVRLDDGNSCVLIIMAAAQDGYRESKIARVNNLVGLKRRAHKMNPKLSVDDGGLGFWAGLSEVYPQSRKQHCWVHKTSNILDKMPKSTQSKAKTMIHDYLSGPRQAGCPCPHKTTLYPLFQINI